MKIKKLMLSVLALVLVCAISVTGTLAYLKATTEEVVNTFSTIGLFNGPVEDNFKLLETAVDEDYQLDFSANPVTGISYENITPGMSLYKRPYVELTNKSSVPAWLYIEVVETGDSIFDDGDSYRDHVDTTRWTEFDLGEKAPHGGMMYVLKTRVSESDGTQTFTLFPDDNTQFFVDDFETPPEDYTLTLYAYMCQTTYDTDYHQAMYQAFEQNFGKTTTTP